MFWPLKIQKNVLPKKFDKKEGTKAKNSTDDMQSKRQTDPREANIPRQI